MKNTLVIILILFAVNIEAFSQKTVKGVVVDETGLPMIGANVIVKNTNKGTITNLDGAYVISGVKSDDILIFRYVGYEDKGMKVGNQFKIDIKLLPSSIQLEETVVIGYGTAKKVDLTGAVASVNTQDLAKAAMGNFDQALAGRITGVQVTSTDGTPGEALNIVIRGGNSITGSNSPLYVIDGIPMEDFDPASVSTRDIKSFDILKDASATAIYGARGANGVILITTKGGRNDGQSEITFHARVGLQYIPNRLEVMNPYEYVKYQKKVASANDNYVPGNSMSIFNRTWVDPELYRETKGTSWQNEIFQTALLQDYSVSIGGGTKKSSYYYSGGCLDQTGTLINTSFRKFNNRLKFNTVISDALTIGAQITYNYTIRTGLQTSGNQYTSVISDAITFRPINPIYTSIEEDNKNQDQDPYQYNPVKGLMNTDRKRVDDEIAGNVQLQYNIFKNLSLNVTGSYYRSNRESSLFYRADTQQASNTADRISGQVSKLNMQTLTNSNTLRYNTKIGKNKIESLVGVELQQRDNLASSFKNTRIPTDAFGVNNLGIATGSTIATTSKTRNTLLSYLGRVNYNYGERYLATLNFRTDGSSKFKKQNRWGYFPSFSAAWRVSEEKFMKSIPEISNLKVRLGWGTTGNNRIKDFEAYNLMSIFNNSGYVMGDAETYHPGAVQSNMGVPDLRWEVTVQYNAGVDFGLFKNRISGTVDYYLKRTTDLLLNAQMAPSTGFSTVQQNVGEVQNSGLEFSLNTINIQNKNFSWSSSFNISFNRNKTIKLNSGQSEILIDPNWNNNFMQTEYQYVTRVGKPVGMMYGLEFDGLYQMDDFTWTNGKGEQLKPGIPSYVGAMKPGMSKYIDQLTVDTNGDGIPDAGDGVINSKDRVIIGNPHPIHIGGLSNDFRYKDFDLQVLLQWSYGADIMNANRTLFTSTHYTSRNGLAEMSNVWTPNNTNTNISGIRYDGQLLNEKYGYKMDSRFIEDGSYLKIKSVVLGYSLPKKALYKLKMKSCRFSVSAQNLLTITKYSGYNPDVSVGRFGALTPNLDYSAYPQSVAISAGIDILF